ncbi:MAG: hypothetical protein MUC48_02325 [Leptolyngbya sp. Prado105]|nr:hypothetical protein [Leptolyngbya sp. Prado105]
MSRPHVNGGLIEATVLKHTHQEFSAQLSGVISVSPPFTRGRNDNEVKRLSGVLSVNQVAPVKDMSPMHRAVRSQSHISSLLRL